MSGVAKGRDTYDQTHRRAGTEPSVEDLAKTATGRGALVRRARSGDQEAAAALRAHRTASGQPGAAYDDPFGVGTDA